MRPSDAARLVALGAIWGSSFLFIEVALEDLTPLQIVFGRIATGAVFLTALLFARGERLPRGRDLYRSLTVMAVVSSVAPFILIAWGQQEVSSSLASILNSTTPLFTVLLAALFIGSERLRPARLAGVVLGFAGVGVIVGLDSAGSTSGKVAITLASVSYASGFVYARRHLVGLDLPPLAIPATQLLIATAMALPLALIDTLRTPPTLSVGAVGSIVFLGVLGSGVAYMLYYRLISDVGATSSSFVTYLIPIFGVTLGAVVLDEELGLNVLVGALLVIAGIALAELAGRRKIPSNAAGGIESATEPSETTAR
ncbi:MAG: DMT family transporter [Actinomycetota bacterium]